MGGNIPGGNFPGADFLRGEFDGWEFSRGGGGEFSKNRFLTSLSFRNELTAASKMSALTLHL